MNEHNIAVAAARNVPNFERILEGLPHPVLVIDSDCYIVYANAPAQALFGGLIAGLKISDIFPAFSAPIAWVQPDVTFTLTTSRDVDYDVLINSIGGGYSVLSMRASGVLARSGPTDIDDLTGLVRRNTFMDELNHALRRAEARGTIVAVHYLDLDRFKMVNDTLGHAVGDLLLKKVADRLKGACRKDDIIARLGGDEFVILQLGIAASSDAERLAARLVDLVGRTYVLSGLTVNIGVSVGLAFNGEQKQARDILRDADLALYEAKRAGRGRYRSFEPGMNVLLHERRELEIDLRRALALKQFDLHYQPFLDLASDTVIGFEALLRWNHPVRGNVPPLDFIPMAEENGLIVKIGEWVLGTACATAASWPNELIVAVNVSPLQFKADTLLDTVRTALERSGLSPHRLELEITESALLDDTDNVLATLHALKDQGVKISMDDFGTGYSSLSYLQKFPFDKIKIDRCFIADSSADSEAIFKAVAGLGTSLGMAITAEGVETTEQLERIRSERCTHVQGYLTGRPMAADKVAAFLTSRL